MDGFLLCLHLASKVMESQVVSMENLLVKKISAVQLKKSPLRFVTLVTRDRILTWRIQIGELLMDRLSQLGFIMYLGGVKTPWQPLTQR